MKYKYILSILIFKCVLGNAQIYSDTVLLKEFIQLKTQFGWVDNLQRICKGNCTDGKGTLINELNQEYTGIWTPSKYSSHSIINGACNIIFENKDKYEGGCKNSMPYGNGTYYYNVLGNKYEGEWIKGKREGRGKYFFHTGEIFTGKWVDNFPKGIGRWKINKDNIHLTWEQGLSRLKTGCLEGNCIMGTGLYRFESGQIYRGSFLGGLQHGYGCQAFIDEGSFCGNYRFGKIEGPGTYSQPNHSTFYGNYISSYAEGPSLILFESNGILGISIYNLKHDKKFGSGLRSIQNKIELYSTWKNDQPQDPVLKIWGDSSAAPGHKYIGPWEPGPDGTYYYPNGDKYVGNYGYYGELILGKDTLSDPDYDPYWDSFVRHGLGTYSFQNGDRYIGFYTADHKNGLGTYFYSNGDRYEGNWKNDTISGFGTAHYANGDCYEGNWSSDAKNGTGTYYYQNGESYSGNFQNDAYQGQGTYRYPDGSFYKGQWKKNQPHGQGTFTFPNGKTIEGSWKNGLPEGAHKGKRKWKRRYRR